MAYKQELWDEAKGNVEGSSKDRIHDMYEKSQRKSEQKAKRKRENK